MPFAMCVSSLLRCLFRFLGFSFSYCQVLRVLLDNSPVSDMYFVNIFTYSLAFLFILFKCLPLITKPSLSIFSSMGCAFGVVFSHCQTQGYIDFPSMFSSRNV